MNENNLRVLQMGKFYPVKGGVEKVEYDLMLGLSQRGVRCDMLCAAYEGGSRVEPVNDHARLICCRTVMRAAATMIAPSMVRVVRHIVSQYDLVHIHHPDPMACLALYLSDYRGRVVLHWHSDIQKQRLLLHFYSPLQSWLLRRADAVVATSPVVLRESPFLRGVLRKAVCFPIGVSAMRPDPAEVEALRARYGGRKIVFSLGRLVPYKGYRYLIEAARYLDDGYVVLIGGVGPLCGELLDLISAYGVHDRVQLLGYVSEEDLPTYYGACTLFCLSSVQKTEAFGIVQIEAMSCGKPVVATRIPGSGVAWVNQDGVSGLNVEPANARALAEAIKAVADHQDAYERFALGAGKRYRDLFTHDRMIDNCIRLYLDNG